MPEAKTEQEPSIEEILESIRQIISDDGEPQPAPQKPAPQPVPVSAAPAPTPAVPPPPPPTVADEEDIIDLVDVVAEEPAKSDLDLSAQPEEPAQGEYTYTPPPEDNDKGMGVDLSANLLSDDAAAAASAAMARLLAGNVAVERDLPGRPGNVTLEDMARELMRPLLKTWLDQNLPQIVEKIVAREVEKVSRRG